MAKNAHFDQTAYKKRYNNLCIRFGTWKVRRLNQSRSKVTPKAKFPAGSRRKERLSRSKLKQALLTDSDAELFMYLIQCIRLGVWTGPYLNIKIPWFCLIRTKKAADNNGLAPLHVNVLKYHLYLQLEKVHILQRFSKRRAPKPVMYWYTVCVNFAPTLYCISFQFIL